jgi:hypothetical protein
MVSVMNRNEIILASGIFAISPFNIVSQQLVFFDYRNRLGAHYKFHIRYPFFHNLLDRPVVGRKIIGL